MLDVYGDVASGLKECLSNMGPWSLGDLTLGIRHVGKRHDKQDISDRLTGPPLAAGTSASTYAYLRREIKFAQAVYSIPDSAKIVAKSELPDTDCILHVYDETAKFRPAFMLVKDNEEKLIRVVVRGTNDLNDVLTDMAGVAVPVEGGSAHEGMLQAANWLLDEAVPLLEQLPKAEISGYGLRFSGHSLGAGTAALAAYLIQTRPTAPAYASLRAIFPLSRITCFCASPPPVLSLLLSQSTQEYMTTCVLDHDVVSRASIANFEQLRLEVLSSGWWNGLVDPVVKSTAFEKVLSTLQASGAHQMIGLVAMEADAEGRPAEGATGGASSSTGPKGAGSAGDMSYAMGNLHHLYAQPTTKERAAEKAVTGDKISALIDSYMEASRKNTSEYGEKMLSKASALSKRPKHELAAVAAAGVAAAAAAWWATAPAGKQSSPKKKEEGLVSSAGASPTARASGAATDTEEGGKKGSWLSTAAWLAQGAAAVYAAGNAVSATVSTAGDIAEFMNPADKPRHSMASSSSTPAAQYGSDHRSQGPPLTPPEGPIGTMVDSNKESAAGLSNLDQSISSVRLYAPGRLHHLQRTTETPEVVEAEGDGADDGAKQEGVKQRSILSIFSGRSKKKSKVPEQFVLVRGEPSEARFEFIAVRQTWISDHMLTPMLEALQSAETGLPVPDE